MAEVKKKFKKFDKNGDGKISRNELKDVLHVLGSRTTSNENDDGFISLDKFVEFHMGELTSSESYEIYELQK
ncbi:polcalcin che a 3 [Quercus suber]|uniref:Polcalcin che a 3 n=1 Tax=Quercus suber TaxID=58331 RepID=A0AAW0KPV4_QUESU